MKARRPTHVLDSYAVLAYLQNEVGSRQVAEAFARAQKVQAEILLCIVNFGEVLYIIEREHGLTDARQAIAAVDQLPIAVIDAGRALTFAAAHIKARHSISFADAFAVALAQREQAAVLTGDPEFKKVETLVKVEWLSRI